MQQVCGVIAGGAPAQHARQVVARAQRQHSCLHLPLLANGEKLDKRFQTPLRFQPKTVGFLYKSRRNVSIFKDCDTEYDETQSFCLLKVTDGQKIGK